MTPNEFKTSIELQRIEICDLMLACTECKFMANDGGKKWERLHDKLESKLRELDKQLEEMRDFYTK